jgi:hypothetical protein
MNPHTVPILQYMFPYFSSYTSCDAMNITMFIYDEYKIILIELRGLSLRANYTGQAPAASRHYFNNTGNCFQNPTTIY